MKPPAGPPRTVSGGGVTIRRGLRVAKPRSAGGHRSAPRGPPRTVSGGGVTIRRGLRVAKPRSAGGHRSAPRGTPTDGKRRAESLFGAVSAWQSHGARAGTEVPPAGPPRTVSGGRSHYSARSPRGKATERGRAPECPPRAPHGR